MWHKKIVNWIVDKDWREDLTVVEEVDWKKRTKAVVDVGEKMIHHIWTVLCKSDHYIDFPFTLIK